MFGHRRFRFRSPERNREADERRLSRVRSVVQSAISEAQAEFRGLRSRITRTRRSLLCLVAQVEEHALDPACRAELTNLEQALVAGEQSLAQLEEHLAILRKLERGLHRLIDQPRVSGLKL
jgi:hypothetical protein